MVILTNIIRNLFQNRKSCISKGEIRNNIDENIRYSIELMDSSGQATSSYGHMLCGQYADMKKHIFR